MMSKIQQIAKSETEAKLTENDAFAYNTTGENELQKCYDLFAVAGALRVRDEEDILLKFKEAFNENQLLTTKMLFYTGNIRGGLGERRTFRICLKWLAQNYPSIVIKNMNNIPLFNRYDSLFELVCTPVEKHMWNFILKQLLEDSENMSKGKPISLLAKWMPSENASSKETILLAKRAIRALKMTPRQYRKILSSFRKYIDVIEIKMSNGDWNQINYESVPSRAMKNYNQAFYKHSPVEFGEYLESLNKGEKKINASTLYPYDIVESILYHHKNNSLVSEQQWKVLPNYVEDGSDILVMADVSGSMYGRPMATSIGLAVYFAQRNKGQLARTYMTFTNQPHFQYINEGDSLETAIYRVSNTDIGYSTNLERAFEYLLNSAVENDFSGDDIPSAICVISDMEIDRYSSLKGLDFVRNMKRKFEEEGFKMPKLILWNVEARNDTFLSQDEDVIYVSGQSPSIFKRLIGDLNGVSGIQIMVDTLSDKMYDCVVV